MERKIIVGFDGSAQAQDALALGRSLAQAIGARIVLADVYVHETVPLRGDPGYFERIMREEAEQVLAQADVPDDAERRAVPAPSAPHGLHRLAEDEGALVLVVGSSHRGAIGRLEPGGVAQRLLHACPCSVAVAPAGYAATERTLRRIAVGYTDTDEGAAALRAAAALAGAIGAALQVVSVAEHLPQPIGKGGDPTYPEYVHAVREDCQRALDEALASLPESIPSEGVLLDGHAADALQHHVAANADLLVVGSRGYGPLRQVLGGSVSGELLRHAKVPVLVVPRGGESELVASPAASAAAQHEA